MKHPRDWTVATLLDRRITLGELGRKVTDSLWELRKWLFGPRLYDDRIPDPLRVLQPAVADKDQLDWTDANAEIAGSIREPWLLVGQTAEGGPVYIRSIPSPAMPPDWDDVILRGTN